MSQHVYWVSACTVKPGKLEDLKVLMNEMVASVQANEPGALNYEWSISEDGERCHLYERYADSAAALKHLDSFRTNFARRFVAALDVKSFVVYGYPDDAEEALSKMGALFMKPFGGFAR